MIETRSIQNADSVSCPKCGCDIESLDDMELYEDQAHGETDCPHCGSAIEIMASLSKTYIATVSGS